jgi:chromosome segregation ATPase
MSDDFFQQLTHIGSALGPIGVTITGFLGRAIKQVTNDVAEAKRLATAASTLATSANTTATEAKALAQQRSDGGHPAFEAFKNAIDKRFADASQELRALVERLIAEAERRWEREVERILRGSRPEGGYENDALLAELRTTLEHEQEQRVALQETLTGHMKDGVERWLRMERFIGSIETTVEGWERERRALEEKINSLQNELRSMRSRPR